MKQTLHQLPTHQKNDKMKRNGPILFSRIVFFNN